MHPNSKLIFEKYAAPIFKSHTRVLEIGPNQHPSTYQEIVGDNTITWETLDMNTRHTSELTYVTDDEYSYPIPSNTFDIVFSAQVIEHVKKAWVWMKELSRICKSGGYVITINPLSWHYHESPVDCWRIYPEGMKALYEEAGLKVITSKCESLHIPESLKDYKHLIPGVSYQTKYSVPKLLIKQALRLPIVYTLDTITIGIKEHESK
ncbi:MAG TPA: methyltransferase domain-containing protein [Candidatus Sericytochromatia bacterium]|jgi:SAM-dependent methyltransferase